MAEEIQFYDEELPVIQGITERLSMSKHLLTLEAFEGAARDAFGSAGYDVDVVFKPTNNAFLPKIVFLARNSNHPRFKELQESGFDHDQKRWEVQTDLLGGGKNAGALTNDGRIISPSKSTAFTTKKD